MEIVETYLALFGIREPKSFFSNDELQHIVSTLNLEKEKGVDLFDRRGNISENKIQNIQTPYLDLFVQNRLKEKGIEQRKIWPNKHPFAVCLTHDVDRVELYSPKVYSRNIKKRLRHTKGVKEKSNLYIQLIYNSIKSVFYKKTSDPIWNYEKWIEIEEKFNVKSTYFFFTRTNANILAYNDCDFDLDDLFKLDNKWITVADYIRLLDSKGYEIGLHGSFKAAVDSEVFKKQKEKLESVIQKPVVSTRQHYLRYKHGVTSEIHVDNQIKIDSTIGLNDFAGFRAGTSMPFIIKTKNGYLWELPLIFMEKSILDNQNKSFEETKLVVDELINQVEGIGGCLTVNFHPDYVNKKDYVNIYKYILEEVTKRNAYVGTCQDIVNIVNKNS